MPDDQQVLDRMVELWGPALKADFGEYDLIDVAPKPETGPRKVLVPKSATSRTGWVALYVTAGRLIVDEYCPEAFDGTL